MRKIYLILLLCSLALRNYAQTVTIYSTGAATTYKTGFATATARTGGNVRSNTSAPARRGYAVFDLSSIPTNAQIVSCTIGYNVTGYTGAGTPTGVTTYGYAGDLSTVTTAATLFADCITGTSLSNTAYGAIGNRTITPTAATVDTFIAHNIGNIVSICFTGGGPRTWTMTGGTGTSTTTGTHAPYLQITYCVPLTGVSATASTDTLCGGSSLSLTGTATGATSYTWTGPGGYTSTSLSPTFAAAAANTGVFTLTATNSCYTVSATTSAVVVGAPPAVITGTTVVCPAATTTLHDAAAGGTWHSASTSIATIDPTTGVATGVTTGTSVISYATPGCSTVTTTLTVSSVPPSISATATPNPACLGDGLTLTGSASGATSYSWSGPGSFSSTAATATLTAATASAGIYTLTAYNACGSSTSTTSYVTVSNPPLAISGPSTVCQGVPTTVTDGSSGGVWSSSDTTTATISSGGAITGVVAGSAHITYTLTASGCFVVAPVSVMLPPASITGFSTICPGSSLTLSDAVSGGTWSSSASSVASINSSGVVHCAGTGFTTINYSNMCGTATLPFTVNSMPASISGPASVCLGSSPVVSDITPGGNWNTTNASVLLVDSFGNVSTYASDTATISYITGIGCIATMVMAINPTVATSVTITDSPSVNICAGTPVNFVATAVNGGSSPFYNWKVTGVPMGTGNTFSYTPAVGDFVSCDMASSLPCPSIDTATDGFAMAILPHVSPIVNVTTFPQDTIAYLGQIITFYSDVTYSGTSPHYQWYVNGAAVAGATSNSFSTSVYWNDTVYCRLISNLPCSAPDTTMSNKVTIYGAYLAVNNVNSSNDAISVYPNPGKDVFYVKGQLDAPTASIEVTDISGRAVISTMININNGNLDYTLPMAGMPQGIYLLKISSANGTQTLKLVVE